MNGESVGNRRILMAQSSALAITASVMGIQVHRGDVRVMNQQM